MVRSNGEQPPGRSARAAPAPRQSTQETSLERHLAHAGDAHPGESGFRLISKGIDALAIRLLLADQAERSIDAQYYEIEDDLAGRLFLEALLRAAARGVRVRLLLDDYRTTGHDSGLATLRSHPNFELRIYNPYLRRSPRLFEGITRFARINRRMHNKSFTVDDQITLIGGRNIGDPYFSVGHEVNFSDLDVVAIGPIVADVSRMFDEFWESPAAVPVDVVALRFGDSTLTLPEILERVSRARAEIGGGPYAEAIRSSIVDKLERDLSEFTWAPCRLVFDRPEKTYDRRRQGAAALRQVLVEAFEQARHEVLVISPYFVPRPTGLRRFRQLTDRGLEVTVVTNSLASNNQIYAHGGYAPARRRLLRMGVALHELRADARVTDPGQGASRATLATLHTKAFVIDRRQLFIGSFNFDPRSANINTEMGVFIESPELAEVFVQGTRQDLPDHAFALELAGWHALRWRGRSGQDDDVVFRREPLAGFWKRVAGQAARLLPIRGQV